MKNLSYPIGKYVIPENITEAIVNEWIATIANFPTTIRTLTENLNSEILNTPYRPDGWTVRQVVHHCADSHTNAFTRFKLALTEDSPTIRPYFEDKWAALADANNDEIEDSLMIITGLHNRWTKLLKQLTATDLQKGFFHPEHGQFFTLAETIGNYAWHSQHHLAHIRQVIG
jgi:hypothetical protein